MLQVSRQVAPSQFAHQRQNPQMAPQHVPGQPAAAPGHMPRVSPPLTQLMSGTSHVPQQSPIVSQSQMPRAQSGQRSPVTSQISSGQIHTGVLSCTCLACFPVHAWRISIEVVIGSLCHYGLHRIICKSNTNHCCKALLLMLLFVLIVL